MTVTANDQQGRAAEVASSTKDGAAAVAGATKAQAGEVVGAARSEVRDVADNAKQQARRTVDEAAVQLRTQAEEQTVRLAHTFGALADELRTMSEAGDGGTAHDLARQASQSLDRVGARLAGDGVDGVVADLKRTARNRPGLFLLGALGAGVAAGRLLRGTQAANSGSADSAGEVSPPAWDAPSSALPPGAMTPLAAPMTSTLDPGQF
ncbi:MAG: hypothetical protein H0V33_12690 [Acidimicrobiia bacterium]|jgi:hypothetical protein|nr:hypothetical protein [Acidimicrobiia bacterium]